MYCRRKESMNQSALAGFIKIVELNSFKHMNICTVRLP